MHEKVTRYFLLIIGVVYGILGAEETQRRPMTVDDALNIIQIGDPLISPDGNSDLLLRIRVGLEQVEKKTSTSSSQPKAGNRFNISGKREEAHFNFLRMVNSSLFTNRRKIQPDFPYAHIRWRRHSAYQTRKLYGSFEWAPTHHRYCVASEPRTKDEEKEIKQVMTPFL